MRAGSVQPGGRGIRRTSVREKKKKKKKKVVAVHQRKKDSGSTQLSYNNSLSITHSLLSIIYHSLEAIFSNYALNLSPCRVHIPYDPLAARYRSGWGILPRFSQEFTMYTSRRNNQHHIVPYQNDHCYRKHHHHNCRLQCLAVPSQKLPRESLQLHQNCSFYSLSSNYTFAKSSSYSYSYTKKHNR
jgi:hypothetical protein